MSAHACAEPALPGQLVLVFQGGGALGAFQHGVYEALEEAGLAPDWVVGTSIGAINAALIAGNRGGRRLGALADFWDHVARPDNLPWSAPGPALATTFLAGIPGFFTPSLAGLAGPFARLGVDAAAYYRTDALRRTLEERVDFALPGAGGPRLTVGAVSVRTGRMRYFDSARERLDVRHVMASGALPPAFPAVAIDGEPFWDGGIYSNSPVEVVFDDNPRRSSVVFAVQLWDGEGPAPESLWEVSAREKDIRYASRIESHIARQEQIHHLRHIILALGHALGPRAVRDPEIAELLGYGCSTEMHVVRLVLPRTNGADPFADADFSAERITGRRRLGREIAARAIADAPWTRAIDPRVGVALHEYR